jgi:hypothetical protein
MQAGKGMMRRVGGYSAAMCAVGCLGLAVLAGGCGATVPTPLPDVKPVASTAMSQDERKKAVDELNRKRATHEQDAEQQIEQSR